jgi:hypothetical protein
LIETGLRNPQFNFQLPPDLVLKFRLPLSIYFREFKYNYLLAISFLFWTERQDISNNMDQPQTFPKFSKLPAEVRINIWKMAMPEPQPILIYSRRRSEEIMEAESERNSQDVFTLQDDLSDSEDEWVLIPGRKRRQRWSMPKRPTWPYKLCATYKVPVLLHTNFEAREIAMKAYKLSFGLQLHQKPVWFDSGRDTLVMASCGVLQMFSQGPFALRQHQARFRHDVEDVRCLALPLYTDYDYDHISDRGLKHFKNLNTLVIITHSHHVWQKISPTPILTMMEMGHQEIDCYVKGIRTKVMNDRVFKIEFPSFQHWQLSDWKGKPYQISLNIVENLRKQAISARISRHLYKLRKQNLPNFDKMYRRVINGDGLFPPCPSIKGWMSKFVPALDLYEFRLR